MSEGKLRKSLNRVGLFLAAAAALAVLSSCGKSDDSSSSAAEQSSADDSSSGESFVPQTFDSNVTGTEGGYSYELWKDSGDVEMTLGEGGAFSCKWDNINNSLFRRGQRYKCTETYQELVNISIDYGVDYQPEGNSYMCVYGWTREPLVEYYIVETWGSWRPPGQAECLGTVTADGGVYDIYRTTRVEQPSIDGTKTFDQYWSVRQEKPEADGTKLEGTISVTKHFDAWQKAGLELGKMYEVALNIEGYQSKGQADVYKNVLTVGGEYVPDEALR